MSVDYRLLSAPSGKSVDCPARVSPIMRTVVALARTYVYNRVCRYTNTFIHMFIDCICIRAPARTDGVKSSLPKSLRCG